MEKIITGAWNEEPIWRPKTSAERLSDLLENKTEAELYLKLMEGKITNKEFEELTGAEPTEDNPSRKAWEKRNEK